MNLIDFINKTFYQIDPKSNKSNFGRVLVIGGSSSYVGAPILASDFALLAGVGYVAIALPNSIRENCLSAINKQCIHENLSSENSDNFDNFNIDIISKYDTILFGNGVNINETNLNFLRNLIKSYEGTLVVDASGLTLLSQDIEILKSKNDKLRIVLTPHIKEAKRLLNITIDSDDPKDLIPYASKFACNYKVNILLKSYYSILITQNNTYIKSPYSGIPILAHASSGDMLAGFITGLITRHKNSGLKLTDIVYFGDLLFHYAAKKYEIDLNKATLDSNLLKTYILKYIKENH